jgi:hypothetical protein
MQPRIPAGPFALRYDVRGSEFAVVLPNGDMGALLEVTRELSQVWNGSGTLLLLSDRAGRLRPGLEDSLASVFPDRFLLHPALSEAARDGLQQRWTGRAVPWEKTALQREVHPWSLVMGESSDTRTIHVPQPRTDIEAVVAAVLWGWIDPGDACHLPPRLALADAAAESFDVTLVTGQTSGYSQLAFTARFMASTESLNGPSQRALFVLAENPSFDELVLFWNVRARYPTLAGRPAFIAATTDALGDARFGAAIVEWLDQPPRATKPDLVITTSEANVASVRETLIAAGMKFVDTGGRYTSYSVVPDDRRGPEFAFGPLSISLRLRRGTRSEALIGLQEGINPLHLPFPAELPVNLGWAGLVNVEMSGLPVSFPMSDPLAAECHESSIAVGKGAIAVTFGGHLHPIRMELRIPSGPVQLARHMSSIELRAELSSAGRIASALIGRLDDIGDLDTIARPNAMRVLDALVAPSRKKLAQRVRQELQSAGVADINEDAVVNILKREGLFAELRARTLGQLQGATARPASALLPALGALCDNAYLQRGRALRCPRCNTPGYWRIGDLEERVTCDACRQEFPLPAIEGAGEAPLAYRLDGLVARAMDQDLVPVLLTLRHLLARYGTGPNVVWWPGLDLYEHDSKQADHEIDLLIADRGELDACEIKKDANAVTREEAIALADLAERLVARPIIAAPNGHWRDEVTELSRERKICLLDKRTLLGTDGGTD